MSLGLPEFGSRRRGSRVGGPWGALRLVGLVAFVYAGTTAAMEWRRADAVASSLRLARVEVAETTQAAEETRRWLLKNSDLLVATASIESPPAMILEDLNAVRPDSVSIVGLRIDYLPEGVSRLDLSVVARTAEAYDRFLSALSNSPRFGEIRPGSEIRPGLVRATIGATHVPGGAVE